jgi:RimJ/RimL family protein N-acetyltransferase
MISVVLETPRLLLRPMELHDAPFIRDILSHREISDGMEDYPHPFPLEAARDMILWSQRAPGAGKGYSWAVTHEQTFVGALFLKFHTQPAELGYWIGLPYWGQGFATEAADVVLRCAFETLRLPGIAAYAHADNAGSRRVLEKLGMTLQHVRNYPKPGTGEMKAAAYYEISGAEWQSRNR